VVEDASDKNNMPPLEEHLISKADHILEQESNN